MNLTRSSLKLFAANGIGSVLGLGALVIFSNTLSPNELGIFFIFQAMLNILSIPADFGLQYAVEKRLSEGDRPESTLTTGLLLKLLPMGLVIALLVVFREHVAEYLEGEYVFLLCVALVVHGFSRMMVRTLNGELRVEESAVLGFLRRVSWVGLGVTAVLLGYGLPVLLPIFVVSFAVVGLFGVIKRETAFGRPSVECAKSLLEYARYSFVSSITSVTYNWMDIAVIALILTPSDVSAYEIAWRVTFFVMLMSNAIATSVFPQISEWSSDEKFEKIESLLPDAVTASAMLVIPSFFGVLLFGEEILRFVFSDQYAGAWPVLLVLMSEKLFRSVHVILGRSLQAIDQPDLAALAAFAATTANILLNFALVYTYGIIGAAVATLLSGVLNTVLHAHYLRRFVSVDLQYFRLGWSILSSVVMVGVLLLIESVLPISDVYRLFAVIAIGAIVYFLVVGAHPRFRVQMFNLARRITQ